MGKIMNERLLFLLFLFSFLILAGCLKESKKQKAIEIPESYSLNITSESEEIAKVKLVKLPIEEEKKEEKTLEMISNFTEDINAPLRISFFNVGENERLTLISKGDFDVVISSISEKNIENAVSLIKSNADDVELFIIPYAKTLNNDIKIIENVDVAKIIVPDYDKVSLGEEKVIVEKASNGKIYEGNGIKIEIVTPFLKSFTGDEANSISLYISDRNFSMFIGNDIIEGVIGKIVASNVIKDIDVIVMPSYGKGEAGGANMKLFIDKTKPENAVFEGKGIDLNYIESDDSRAAMVNYLKAKGIKQYFVGNNKVIKIFYNGESYEIKEE